MSMNPIADEMNHLIGTAKEFQTQYREMYRELSDTVVRREYARGGQLLHRGYYCPSPVFDLIVGGVKRGRLLKRLPSAKSTPDVTFGFNEKDQLVTVERSGGGKEFIFYPEDGLELGIGFMSDRVCLVSECRFAQGRLQTYSCCYLADGKDFHKEVFAYDEKGLRYLDWYAFCEYDNNKTSYEHEKYQFEHDEDGTLSRYRAVPCDDPFLRERKGLSQPMEAPFSVYDMEFEITQKRKV